MNYLTLNSKGMASCSLKRVLSRGPSKFVSTSRKPSKKSLKYKRFPTVGKARENKGKKGNFKEIS